MSTIGDQLAHEWHDDEQRITGWFHRHARHDDAASQPGDTIAPDHPYQPAPGATMSLASLAAELRAKAEAAAGAASAVLDEHLPQIEELAAIVDANPVFASAQGAMHVPLEVLQGVAGLLDHYAGAYPKPEPVPVAEAPAEPAAEAAA